MKEALDGLIDKAAFVLYQGVGFKYIHSVRVDETEQGSGRAKKKMLSY